MSIRQSTICGNNSSWRRKILGVGFDRVYLAIIAESGRSQEPNPALLIAARFEEGIR